VDRNELQTVRSISPDLRSRLPRDFGERRRLVAITPRKAIQAPEITAQNQPGSAAAHRSLPELVEIQQPEAGRRPVLHEDENISSAPVCVLGETAKVNLLGNGQCGRQIRESQRHLVAGDRSADPRRHRATPTSKGVQSMNKNNLIITPLNR